MMANHNQEIDKLLRFFDSQAAATRDAMDHFSNPRLEEKSWRSQSKDEVEKPYAFIEQWREGRVAPSGAPK